MDMKNFVRTKEINILKKQLVLKSQTFQTRVTQKYFQFLKENFFGKKYFKSLGNFKNKNKRKIQK